MITKNKTGKIKKHVQIKIFNLARWDNIYPVMFAKKNLFKFVFNQTIIEIDTHIKLIE